MNIRLKDVRHLFSNRTAMLSVSEIDEKSKLHEQLVDDIMNDIRCTVEIADTLTPIVNKPLSYSRKEATPLEKYNSAQLEACTEKLSTFGDDLDKMWKNQMTYYEQAREVCRFEESYSEVGVDTNLISSILKSNILLLYLTF